MSNNAPESRGQFVTPKVTRPPIVVDCSKWVDTSDGTWTFGNFVTPKATREPIIVDCSTWNRDSVVWLELVVSIDEGTEPAAVMRQTLALVNAVRATAPELGIRFEMREEGTSQVVSLRMQATGLDAAHLAELAEVVRKEVQEAGWEVRKPGQAA